METLTTTTADQQQTLLPTMISIMHVIIFVYSVGVFISAYVNIDCKSFKKLLAFVRSRIMPLGGNRSTKVMAIVPVEIEVQLQNEDAEDIELVAAPVKEIKYKQKDVLQNRKARSSSGMFDNKRSTKSNKIASWFGRRKPTKIVLSTQFSLDASGTSDATVFTKLFKDSSYIKKGNFKVYAPVARGQKTCDPNWTDFDWPCRGTNCTCQIDNVMKRSGRPTDKCCWRYSFRYQLEKAKKRGGFMLQYVEEGGELGKGQAIELDMASDLGLKVFQVYGPPSSGLGSHYIDLVIAAIRGWYEGGCHDMSVCTVCPTDSKDQPKVNVEPATSKGKFYFSNLWRNQRVTRVMAYDAATEPDSSLYSTSQTEIQSKSTVGNDDTSMISETEGEIVELETEPSVSRNQQQLQDKDDDMIQGKLESRFPTLTSNDFRRFREMFGDGDEGLEKVLEEYIQFRTLYKVDDSHVNKANGSACGDDDAAHWKWASELAVTIAKTHKGDLLPGVEGGAVLPKDRVCNLEQLPQLCFAHKNAAASPTGTGECSDLPILTRDGHPIIHYLAGRLDNNNVSPEIHAVTIALYLEQKAQELDLDNGNDRGPGRGKGGSVLMVDARKGKGWPNHNVLAVVGFLKILTKTLCKIHPGRMEKLIIYPVPLAGVYAFKMMKRWLPSVVADNLVLVNGSDAVTAPLPKKELSKYVSPEILDQMELVRRANFD